MKTIGILGGLGAESTVDYYTYIIKQYYDAFRDYAYPEIIIYSLNLKEFVDVGYELPDKVGAAIEALHRAGAHFAVAACNSVHVVYDEISPGLPIPWISIVDVTAESIQSRGINKIGLLGTVFTMSKGFYHKGLARHGIEAITPDADEQRRVNDIIYGELIRREINETSRRFLLGCIEELRDRGAEGVVLGCTELPMLIQQKHTDVPVFDTTTIHAQRALDLALGKAPLPSHNAGRA